MVRSCCDWKTLGTFAVLFALLVAWEREVLWFPPYEDQAVGLWTEADFLATSGFDYYQLRYGENHFISTGSGVRSYMISLLPTLIAILMRETSDPEQAFFWAHLVTLACGAGIITLLSSLLRGYRLPRLERLLIAGALVTTPLFRTQLELLGMDIPLAFFAMLSLVEVQQERFVRAGVAGMLAFFMKATGNLITLGLLFYLALRIWTERTESSGNVRRHLWRSLAVNLGFAVVQWALIAWGDTSVSTRREITWPAILQLPYAIYWCPDVVVLLAVCAFAWFPELMNIWKVVRGNDDAARVWLRGRGPELIAWFVVLGIVAASSVYIFIPRYFTVGVPLLWLIAGTCLSRWSMLIEHPAGNARKPSGWLRRLAAVSFGIYIVFNLLNAEGMFFPDIETVAQEEFRQDPGLHERSCPFSERSLEYRRDLASNRQGLAVLERESKGRPVLLPQPYYFLATKPRLGYVKQPLRAVNATVFSDTISAFRDLVARESPGEVIIAWTGRSRVTVPPPANAKEILYEDELRTPLLIYSIDTSAIGGDSSQIEEWYLDQTWPGDWLSMRAIVRREFLKSSGRGQRASREIQYANREDPYLREDLRRLAGTMVRTKEPWAELFDADRFDPLLAASIADVLRQLWAMATPEERGRWKMLAAAPHGGMDAFELALLELLSGRRDEAQGNFWHAQQALSGRPQGMAALALAVLEREQGNLVMSEQFLVKAEDELGETATQEIRGLLLCDQGDYAAATPILEKVDRKLRDAPEVHYHLGIALARQGKLAEATQEFRKAERSE